MMKHKHCSKAAALMITAFGLLHPSTAADGPDEPAGVLTLAQALSLADVHHPELQAARLDVRAAAARVSRAATFPNPVLSFEAENFGGTGEQQGFDAADYTAQIEQTIELGGKRVKRVGVAGSEKELSDSDLEGKRLDVRAETTRRYVAVLGAQAHAGLAGENVGLAEDLVRAVSARVEAGKVPPTELETAQVLLARKRIELEKAQGDLSAARIRLVAQWGGIKPVFERAAGAFLDVPTIPQLPELISRLDRNPDVARRVMEVKRAQAVLAQEKAARLPDLTVSAGFRRVTETESDILVAGVSLPLPVFDRNKGGIREAEYQLAKAKQQQYAAGVSAASDLAASHQLLVSAANKASALKEAVLPRIKSVAEAVQSGYTQGKYTYLEALDAQRTLVECRAEHIDSLIAAHSALADLERIGCGESQIQKLK